MSQPATLCLLSGLLCDAALWRHQVAALGDGWNCRIPALTEDDSLAAMAARVLEAMPGRFALAGFSMGGYLTFEILRQAPERITRLALIDSRATPDSPADRQRRRDLLARAAAGPFRAVTEALLPRYLHESRLSDSTLTGEIRAMAERLGPAVFARQMAAIMARPDSRPLLPGIACPTLILCGRQDAVTTLAESEAMAAAIPGAALVVAEDCGHFAPLERPELVTGALRAWLAGAATGTLTSAGMKD